LARGVGAGRRFGASRPAASSLAVNAAKRLVIYLTTSSFTRWSKRKRSDLVSLRFLLSRMC
jgi:hypothetical protein